MDPHLAIPALVPEAWSAVGQCLLGGAAIVGGAWAVFNYHRSRRGEAAKWLQGLFKDFYTEPNLIAGRELIEYDYEGNLERLASLRVTARYIRLSARERDELRQLDLTLNFLEQLIYLEEEGHITARDRCVFFQYWFDLLRDPGKAALRRYLATCGYEKCSKLLDVPATEYVAFYGTLMKNYDSLRELNAASQVKYVSPCTLDGELFNMGEWPSLVPGDGRVHGELFEVLDRSVFRKLDPFERFDPGARETSGYLRVCMPLRQPAVDAWVYIANEPVEPTQRIESGSWVEFDRARRPE